MNNRSERQSQPDVRVARTLDEVLAAWRLVHDAYVAKGIIDRNPFGLHTNNRAARPGSLVICGDTAGELTSTLTITREGNFGLPLDDVYEKELSALRSRGTRLYEFGLFTHRRSALPLRMLTASVEHALPDESSAIVIGVHPRHAGFYNRMFGFTRLSDARQYRGLNGVPVCLLHLDRKSFVVRPGPPVTRLSSAQAYDFAPSAFSGTILGHYLDSRGAQGGYRSSSVLSHPKEQASP